MVYAMFSIGILGFLVWSLFSYSPNCNVLLGKGLWLLLEYLVLEYTVALPYCEVGVINIAICWNSLVLIGTFSCKNSISYTQSAGNPYTQIKCLTRSSETTRDTSFNFNAFNDAYSFTFGRPAPQYNWLAWFIGFTEGDGAILSYNGRNRFVLTQKEGAILFSIQEVLGFGNVKFYPTPTGGYYRFIVVDITSIKLLALLFNGNLVLPHRISQLAVWANVLGLELNSIPVMPTLLNAWLSGFTDAEGCFNVKFTARPNTVTGYRVDLRFLLDQKNAQFELLHISTLFGFGSVALRGETNQVYRLTINSFKGLLPLRDYVIAFSLKTKKADSLEKWNTVYSMVIAKEHLVEEGLAKIRVLAKEINAVNAATGRTGSSIRLSFQSRTK